MITTPTIGLALSGGGFRATAFGLGCLRALHDTGMLTHVRVVSGISGGSVLAAMWAYGPPDFEEFDEQVTGMLRDGIQAELARRALAPSRIAASTAGKITAIPGMPGARIRRNTRTEALVTTLRSRAFGDRDIADVTHPGLETVISATDLGTTNAVRFGSRVSSCSPLGRITTPMPVADAVAASAAFPILLPPLVRTFDFTSSGGHSATHTLAMTDGGVYDNLGTSPLMPGRSSSHTSHVYDLDYIVAVDAGRGRTTTAGVPYLLRRLVRSFDITYAKTQDGSRAHLHRATEQGQLRGFLHPYLAMQDNALPVPVADYIHRADVITYPTNFKAVPADALHLLTTRGEQLTRTLLAHYCPEL